MVGVIPVISSGTILKWLFAVILTSENIMRKSPLKIGMILQKIGMVGISANGFIGSSKIYDKRDDFNVEIVNFPFLDGDVPCFGIYILEITCFVRLSSNVRYFNNRKEH